MNWFVHFYQDKAPQPLFNYPWIWIRHYSAEMQRKLLFGGTRGTCNLSPQHLGLLCLLHVKDNNHQKWMKWWQIWGENTILMFYARGEKHYIFSVLPSVYNTNRQDLNSLFFPQLVITVALFLNETEISLQSFFSLYAVQDKHRNDPLILC